MSSPRPRPGPPASAHASTAPDARGCSARGGPRTHVRTLRACLPPCLPPPHPLTGRAQPTNQHTACLCRGAWLLVYVLEVYAIMSVLERFPNDANKAVSRRQELPGRQACRLQQACAARAVAVTHMARACFLPATSRCRRASSAT